MEAQSKVRPYMMYRVDSSLAEQERHYKNLIIAGGSDHRAYELLRKCSLCGISADSIVAFDFTERREWATSTNCNKYLGYQASGLNYRTIDCSIKDPSSSLKSLTNDGITFSPDDRIAIDISCFTKPYFFILIKYLKEFVGLRSLTVFYTEPKSYVFSKSLYSSYQSMKGTLRVMEMPGFPGQETGTGRSILIILLGFDGEIASFMSEELATDEIVVVNGFPGYMPKFKDISLINNERLLAIEKRPNPIRYAAANHPFATYNLLSKLRQEKKGAFLSIAPLGTKPMALGACMFAIANTSVRVVDAFPDEYSNVTTNDCYNSWAYDLQW